MSKPDPDIVEEKLVSVETQAEFDLVSASWEKRVFVKLYVAARTSGLLKEISDRDWKTLCILATFMDQDGNCYPSQDEIAEALGVTRQTANERIQSLKEFRFQGKPVVHIQKARVKTSDGSRWANNRYTILPISNLQIFGNDNSTKSAEPMSAFPDIGNPVSGDPDTGNPDTNKSLVVVDQSIVDKLIDLGIHQGVAEQLTMGYPSDYIEEKILLLRKLRRQPDNPAGWLRMAIEENYVLPRPKKGAKRKRSSKRGGAKPAPTAAEWAKIAEDEGLDAYEPPKRSAPQFEGELQALKDWNTAYQELQLQLPKETFDTWLRNARPLSFANNTYTIGVLNIHAREWLEHRLKKVVLRTLSRIVEGNPEVQFVLLSNKT